MRKKDSPKAGKGRPLLVCAGRGRCGNVHRVTVRLKKIPGVDLQGFGNIGQGDQRRHLFILLDLGEMAGRQVDLLGQPGQGQILLAA